MKETLRYVRTRVEHDALPPDAIVLYAQTKDPQPRWERLTEQEELSFLPAAVIWEACPSVTYTALLDALPDGSVVRDGRGYEQYSVYVKNTKDGWADQVWWKAGSDVPESLGEQHFPIEVLAVGSKP